MLNYRTGENEQINASVSHLSIKKIVLERGAYHA